MAKQYPFTLDPFQSTAIACVVRAVRRRIPWVRARAGALDPLGGCHCV